MWVDPRVGARGFEPRAGGMAPRWRPVDTSLFGGSLDALTDVVDAMAAPGVAVVEAAREEDEPWASVTPVPGSSVAMPSGYGPSRGKTTPGWNA